MSIIRKLTAAPVVLCAALSLLLSGCNRPKTIPDNKLEQIFKEIYLTNAYIQTNSVQTDTVEIYLPIFDRHGYTIKDLEYTITDFSKRKSSKFSDIIVAARSSLDAEYQEYAASVRIQDYMDSVAMARYTEQVYFSDSIVVSQIKDTAKLRIIIPITEGQYRISYYSLADTTDQNRSLRASHTMIDSMDKFTSTTSNWHVKGERKNYETTMTATAKDVELLLLLGGYSRTGIKKPALRIDSLTVEYLPLKEQARKMFTQELVSELTSVLRNYNDTITQDSVAFPLGIRRVDTQRDSLPEL